MKLSSPAFEDGGYIPEKHAYRKENVSPPLEIENVPEDAETLVLLMDDPDAKEPAGKVWDHWTVWNISSNISRIEEGSLPEEAVEGVNDYGEKGYGGPNPPDRTHVYRFRLYSLDAELHLPSHAIKDAVEEEMEDHVIEEAELEGKFDPL